ncbi:MAG: class I SAM-dependent methyltransferase [Actinomycetota bacterium]
MDDPATPYYRRDLALIHHLGFAFHAEDCAPGILESLQSVRVRDGLVLELGCGSGLLTTHLVDAGHRVIATDASPAMLDLARGGSACRRRVPLHREELSRSAGKVDSRS